MGRVDVGGFPATRCALRDPAKATLEPAVLPASGKGLVPGTAFLFRAPEQEPAAEISKATSEPDLSWVVDEHESRLPFDVLEFERLPAGRDSKSSN